MPRRKERINRNRYDIYAEIIRVVHIWGYCPLTRVARSTNLPVDRAKDSIALLVKKGLLDEDEEEGRRVYKVTVLGHQYFELYKRMASLVGMPMPDPIIGM